MEVTVSFSSIMLAAFIFYFVIKQAVKNGINNSMLFTDEQENQTNPENQQE